MTDIGILTTIHNAFVMTMKNGYSNIIPDIIWLFRTLAVMEIVMIGMWLMFGKTDAAEILFGKIILLCFIWLLLSQWPQLTDDLKRTMVKFGLNIGDASFPVSLLSDPSKIAKAGVDVSAPIWDYIHTKLKWYDFSETITLAWAGIFIILAYFVMAIQVLLTQIEFMIVTLVALVFIPFTIFVPTRWISFGFFRAILGMGVKLLVLAIIISIAVPLVSALIIPAEPTLASCWGVLLGAMGVAFLAWHVPSLAGGLIAGQPSLSTGKVAATAVGGGLAAMRGGGAIKNSVNQMGRGAGSTIKAAGSAHTAYSGGTRLNALSQRASQLSGGGSGNIKPSMASNMKAGTSEVRSAGVSAIKDRFLKAVNKR